MTTTKECIAKSRQTRNKGKEKPTTTLPQIDVSHPALKDLNLRHAQCIALYLSGMTQEAAAQSVGYSEGYAGQLFTKPKIKSAIVEIKKTVAERLGITTERLLKELSSIAFFDPRKLFDADGNILPVTELDEDTARAVAGIDISVFGKAGGGKDDESLIETVKKIKLASKISAIDLLGRHVGAFTERKEHTGKDGGPIQVQAVPYTDFPPEPKDLAEWEAQRRAAAKAREKDDQEAKKQQKCITAKD